MGRPSVYVRLDVSQVSGPLYDGRARAAAYQMIDKSKQDLADVGLALLHASSAQFRQHPTWLWETSLNAQVTNRRNDLLLNDPVRWARWLEGITPRNARTRFKGYHMWARTWRRLQGVARPILERNIADFIAGMGGK